MFYFFFLALLNYKSTKKQKRGFLAQQYDEPKSRRGHFTIGEIQWVRNTEKGKFLIFLFGVYGVKGSNPYAVSARSEKRLIAPSKFDGSAGDNLQNGFNKIAEIRRNYFVIVL